ncbi:MAG TPA: sigma 54-interacting transcriptional regulator [Candidatus Saccharimonadales bacterium]|nr:sigma 54-interacting transcriptional regulator [Candidatus Saccharimonadales bacterium]
MTRQTIIDRSRRGGSLMAEGFSELTGEEARLDALRRTALLDSAPEEAFDRLTRLAAMVLRVPTSLVSLVDANRLFFKSHWGQFQPLTSTREIPAENSFCRHAIKSGEPLLVPDARQDPRFSHSASVSDFGVVAYAGIPLVSSAGHAFGTFCVVDGKPRDWTEEDLGILRVLATSTTSEIELRSLAGELRSLTRDLQGLVEARTSELRASEERQRLLLDVNNAIVTCLDRDSLFTAITGALQRVIPFDRAALILHDPVKEVFRVLGVAGSVPSPPVIPLGTEWPRQKSRAGWILDHGEPVLTKDLRAAEPFVEHDALIREGILSVLSVPLTIKGRIIGTLNVGSRETGRYGEDETSLLTAIADQVALALANLLAYEEIAALKARLEEENLYLQEEVREEAAFGDVVGESRAIRGVLASVSKVAGTDSTVLVTGETGTGKELIVRAIHGLSRRKDKILVKVNCAALPSGVIESELFGHEKGAFTGALARKIGRFELANGGTLFLDEIGDLPLELQAKLLRVLQDGEFERVGGTQSLKVDVRLIAATNRDLERAVREERFRADLFYRLNVFPVVIPPLRERLDDVPRLARHFVMIYSSKMGKHLASPGAEAMDRLLSYSWPGNVRELQNVIERAVILSTGGRFEVGEIMASPVVEVPDRRRRNLEDVERRHIVSVLEETGWRVSGDRGAARILGLKRTTLEARMKKLGILRPS